MSTLASVACARVFGVSAMKIIESSGAVTPCCWEAVSFGFVLLGGSSAPFEQGLLAPPTHRFESLRGVCLAERVCTYILSQLHFVGTS